GATRLAPCPEHDLDLPRPAMLRVVSSGRNAAAPENSRACLFGKIRHRFRFTFMNSASKRASTGTATLPASALYFFGYGYGWWQLARRW
ncbi:MAG: hypothetical protein LBK99_22075, partial [Opitutaceae bacterium]|nr:hypothetical protein [Opitutaceae bacterium]